MSKTKMGFSTGKGFFENETDKQVASAENAANADKTDFTNAEPLKATSAVKYVTLPGPGIYFINAVNGCFFIEYLATGATNIDYAGYSTYNYLENLLKIYYTYANLSKTDNKLQVFIEEYTFQNGTLTKGTTVTSLFTCRRIR